MSGIVTCTLLRPTSLPDDRNSIWRPADRQGLLLVSSASLYPCSTELGSSTLAWLEGWPSETRPQWTTDDNRPPTTQSSVISPFVSPGQPRWDRLARFPAFSTPKPRDTSLYNKWADNGPNTARAGNSRIRHGLLWLRRHVLEPLSMTEGRRGMEPPFRCPYKDEGKPALSLSLWYWQTPWLDPS